MSLDKPSGSLLASDVTEAVIGAFYRTYNDLGPGFPEFVSRRALAIVIREAGLPVREEVTIPVWFHGRAIAVFRADLVVAENVIVEVKASPEIEPFHVAQLLHYLKASDLEVGLLVNFGRQPGFKRFVYQNSRKRRSADSPLATGSDEVANLSKQVATSENRNVSSDVSLPARSEP